ncbi:MAG: HEAT repeat domain-containing protein [Planctomycetes bacterium]|nr:HEAT repeat domain-containing protein [Planctomycetota bacterium]
MSRSRWHRGPFAEPDDLGSTDSEGVTELLSLGKAAVPDLLATAASTDDAPVRAGIVQILGRLGDTAALPFVENLLADPAPEVRSAALHALIRFGQPSSKPPIRALLDSPRPGGPLRAELLGALLALGDHANLGELIALGLNDTTQREEAIAALLRHPPLRTRLGVGDDLSEMLAADRELLLRAAKEWHLEQVLHQPSPWRPPTDFAFSGPHAKAKSRAFALLSQQCRAGDGEASVLRVLPVDRADEVAAADPVFVLHGHGHDLYLALDIWEARGKGARAHRFLLIEERDQATPNKTNRAGYAVADFPAATFAELRAGIHAILDATILPWWPGPGRVSMHSSDNFAIVVQAAGPTRAWCGYRGSAERSSFNPLRAARDWHHSQFGDVRADIDRQPDQAARQLFSRVWRQARAAWVGSDDWWWVRERAVAMAGAFGTAELVADVLAFAAPDYAERTGSRQRTAAAACHALERLTGIDLRLDDRGNPRPIAEIARSYRDRLSR